MNDKKISPASLIITGIALILIIGTIVYERHHLTAFVPTPPPTSDTSVIPTYPDTDPSADTGNTTADGSTPISVCYLLNQPSKGATGNDVAYFKLTIGDGSSATGELGTAIAEKDTLTGTVSGTINIDPTDASAYVFTGQYQEAGEGMNSTQPVSISFNQTQATDNGLTIPRVDCTEYDAYTQGITK